MVYIPVLKSAFEYSGSVRRCLEDDDCAPHLILHCTGNSVERSSQACSDCDASAPCSSWHPSVLKLGTETSDISVVRACGELRLES